MAATSSVEARRALVELDGELSVVRQYEPLGLNRSGLYYQSAGESAQNLELMHQSDARYTDITYIWLRRGFVYLVALLDWFSRYYVLA